MQPSAGLQLNGNIRQVVGAELQDYKQPGQMYCIMQYALWILDSRRIFLSGAMVVAIFG